MGDESGTANGAAKRLSALAAPFKPCPPSPQTQPDRLPPAAQVPPVAGPPPTAMHAQQQLPTGLPIPEGIAGGLPLGLPGGANPNLLFEALLAQVNRLGQQQMPLPTANPLRGGMPRQPPRQGEFQICQQILDDLLTQLRSAEDRQERLIGALEAQMYRAVERRQAQTKLFEQRCEVLAATVAKLATQVAARQQALLVAQAASQTDLAARAQHMQQQQRWQEAMRRRQAGMPGEPPPSAPPPAAQPPAAAAGEAAAARAEGAAETPDADRATGAAEDQSGTVRTEDTLNASAVMLQLMLGGAKPAGEQGQPPQQELDANTIANSIEGLAESLKASQEEKEAAAPGAPTLEGLLAAGAGGRLPPVGDHQALAAAAGFANLPSASSGGPPQWDSIFGDLGLSSDAGGGGGGGGGRGAAEGDAQGDLGLLGLRADGGSESPQPGGGPGTVDSPPALQDGPLPPCLEDAPPEGYGSEDGGAEGAQASSPQAPPLMDHEGSP